MRNPRCTKHGWIAPLSRGRAPGSPPAECRHACDRLHVMQHSVAVHCVFQTQFSTLVVYLHFFQSTNNISTHKITRHTALTILISLIVCKCHLLLHHDHLQASWWVVVRSCRGNRVVNHCFSPIPYACPARLSFDVPMMLLGSNLYGYGKRTCSPVAPSVSTTSLHRSMSSPQAFHRVCTMLVRSHQIPPCRYHMPRPRMFQLQL